MKVHNLRIVAVAFSLVIMCILFSPYRGAEELSRSSPQVRFTGPGPDGFLEIQDIPGCERNNDKQEYNAKYGTHLPILVTALKYFPIRGVLELGGGTYSTQLFHQKTGVVQTVENDEKWFQQLNKKFNKSVTFDKTSFGRKEQLQWNDVKRKAETSVMLYGNLLKQHPEINFLFVDHYVALRSIALLSLIPHMDVVVYHDSESLSYGYQGVLLVSNIADFLLIEVTATMPQTSILLRKSFITSSGKSEALFVQSLKEEIKGYCDHSVDYLQNM